jgi:MarR family transcriptional regulator, lower aerobic nicotinate degradation pathway regulator
MTRDGARMAEPSIIEILDAVRRIISGLRRSSRAIEGSLGIGSAQLFVLQELAKAPADSINELAERTFTHQSSVSVVVRRLVRQKLVERRPAKDDRRRRELRLTRAGQRLVARAPVPAQIRLIEGLRVLPAAERRTLARLLNRVVHRMGLSEEEPVMLFSEGKTRYSPKVSRLARSAARAARPALKR